METVGVLFHRDCLQNLAVVDLRRQRQLHQDAMDLRAAIEFGYLCQNRLLGRIRRKLVDFGLKSHFAASPDLVAHVNLRSRIVADENYGEAWRDARLL